MFITFNLIIPEIIISPFFIFLVDFNRQRKQFSLNTLSINNSTKKYVIPPSDQFQSMIENFCDSIIKTSINQNYEKDLLNQAYVMENARKSASQMKVVKIKNY